MTEQIDMQRDAVRRAQEARRLVSSRTNANESIHVETSNKGRVNMPEPDTDEGEEEDERTLAEKLNDIETDTINGNRVKATVKNIEEITDGEGIRVHAELPSGRTVTKRFEMPDSNAKNYKLVRFMGAYGYTIGELDEFEDGTKVDVEIDGNGPTFIIPEEPVREGREEMGAREWISEKQNTTAVIGTLFAMSIPLVVFLGWGYVMGVYVGTSMFPEPPITGMLGLSAEATYRVVSGTAGIIFFVGVVWKGFSDTPAPEGVRKVNDK